MPKGVEKRAAAVLKAMKRGAPKQGRPVKTEKLPVGVMHLKLGRVQDNGRVNGWLWLQPTAAETAAESSRFSMTREDSERLVLLVDTLNRGGEMRDPDEFLAEFKAGCAARHNMQRVQRLQVANAAGLGLGRWAGKVGHDVLLHEGYVVSDTPLDVSRSEFSALLKAVCRAFHLTFGGFPKLKRTWSEKLPSHLRAVHGDKARMKAPNGELIGMRSCVVGLLDGFAERETLKMRRALQTILEGVAALAGLPVEMIVDLVILASWEGMATQAWHMDGEATLSFIVALTPCRATEVVMTPPDSGFTWRDTERLGEATRDAFAFNALGWVGIDEEKLLDGATVGCHGDLQRLQVQFFYSHRVHRSPPVRRGPARLVLYGAFARKKAGGSSGESAGRSTESGPYFKKAE
jgi:hypothetical protein